MSGDTLDFLQGNRETLTGTLRDPAATTGHVLTVQADKSIKAAAGGGGSVVQAFYSGNAVTITNNGNAALTWDTLGGGVDLLDRSTPGLPTFLADGFYSICATVIATTALTAGGFAGVSVGGPDVNAAGTSQNLGGGTGGITVTQVCHYSAGDSPGVNVVNKDGASSRDFTLTSALIVKLA